MSKRYIAKKRLYHRLLQATFTPGQEVDLSHLAGRDIAMLKRKGYIEEQEIEVETPDVNAPAGVAVEAGAEAEADKPAPKRRRRRRKAAVKQDG